MKRKIEFISIPPGEEGEYERQRLESILNDENCVIINKKEEINAKFGLALIYLEYEDYNDEKNNSEDFY